MATQKKRESNSRYLATMKARSIRTKPEEDERIQAAAAAAGQSVQGYILQAVRERMEAVTAAEEGGRVKISVRASALEKLRQPGESAADAVARVLGDAIK